MKNHYLAIAVVHWRKYNGLEFDKKKIKKYLYVIRSILTWKLLDKGIYPPININDLLNHQCTEIGEDVGEAIWNLIDYYKDLKEINEETMFIITNFILNSLNSMKKAKVRHDKNFDAYERRFKEIINLR